MRNLLAVASYVMTALALVAAQEQPPSQSSQTREPIQGPSFRTGIDLVAVDVSVVDKNGRPVDDLLAPDFLVKIDGNQRRVVSADLVKVDVEAARKPQVDKTQSLYTSNLTPPNGRRIVLAIDQVRIGPGSLRPVLDAASRFLDRLSPLDQVSLVAFPEPGVRVDFTNDKVRLRRALQRLVGHAPRSTARRHSISVSEAMAIVDEGTDSSSLMSSSANVTPRETSGRTSGVSGRSTRNPRRWSGRRGKTPNSRCSGCDNCCSSWRKSKAPS